MKSISLKSIALKSIAAAGVFLCVALPAFSQKVPRVVIFPFEWSEREVSADDAALIRNQIIEEISSWGTIAVLDETEAESADFYVQGKIFLDNTVTALTGSTYNAQTDKPMSSYREQAASVSALGGRITSFCTRMLESIPFPNLLLGRWTSVIEADSGPLTCIVEFKSDRTIFVDRFDTREYRQGNILTYQGFGTGTYTYNSQARRLMAIESSGGTVRESPVDGSVIVSLTMEDTLPAYKSLNTNRVRLVFSNSNGNFELLNDGLPCGDNFDGPSVYPGQRIVYTHFTRVQ
ncbi:MAG: hypothetical protein LBE17_06535 [Treponema sp.]|jgi:hypothetical protein|nr:hypothetical protein [Treponema sp.]